MRKSLKRFTSLLMVLTMMVLPTAQISAANKESSAELVQEVIDSVGYEATTTQLSAIEKKRVWSEIDIKLVNIGFYTELQQSSYVESTVNTVEPVKVIDDRFNYLNAYFFMKIYENASGEKVAAMFVFDESTNSLLRVESNTVTAEGELENFFSYSEYDRPMTTQGFDVWGASFACSMAGVIACGAYAAMIGAANVAAGIIVGALCGTAFAAACA